MRLSVPDPVVAQIAPGCDRNQRSRSADRLQTMHCVVRVDPKQLTAAEVGYEQGAAAVGDRVATRGKPQLVDDRSGPLIDRDDSRPVNLEAPIGPWW
jgi:hypothetical protein